MKTCPKCKQDKPEEKFFRDQSRPGGRGCWCKICATLAVKSWERRNYDKAREVQNSWRRRNPEKARRAYLRQTYGMSLEDFIALFASQQGKCAVCETALVSSRDQHVDHCHTTGRVRGILCQECNHGLGNFGDSIKNLAAAAAYLTAAQNAATLPKPE